MSEWREAAFGIGDGDTNFQIKGVSIFSVRWKSQPEPPVQFQEPLYGEWHSFRVYTVKGRPDVRFAATELSNCVWGFLVPAVEAKPSTGAGADIKERLWRLFR